MKPEQAARQEFDEWQNTIVKNFDAILDKRKTSIGEIYQVLLAQGADKPCNNSDQIRIAKILLRLGAKQFRTKHGRFWDVTGVTRG
jgi:hypothetical protein